MLGAVIVQHRIIFSGDLHRPPPITSDYKSDVSETFCLHHHELYMIITLEQEYRPTHRIYQRPFVKENNLGPAGALCRKPKQY